MRLDNEGSPSPDGRLLTYVDWATGDLAVRDLASGKNRHLTNKGTWESSDEFALLSVFSPDGKQVAFSWFNRDKTWDIRVLSLEDAEIPKPRVLYHGANFEYPSPYDWSKDGKQILAIIGTRDQTHQIALVSAVDGSARILKTLDWRAPSKMSLSPDGRYIAYDFPPKENSPQRDIFVLAADGSRESVVAAHPANDLAPIWTPDGKRIVFTSDRTGSMGAWIVTVADGKAQGAPDLLKADIGRMAPMAFTRKSALFYSLAIGDSGIYIATMDPATGKIGEPKGITERFSGFNMSPDWSPDGRFLAFVSRRSSAREPGSTVICIRALGSGEQRELRPELSYFQAVRWAPDGKSLVTWGTDPKGRKGIFQVDAVTGILSKIVAAGDDVRGPQWSPDGQSLYYFDYGNGRVVARDRETGLERDLVPRGRFDVRGLTLSPDGRQLAMLVAHHEKKSMGIDVMSVHGGEPREIVSLPGGTLHEWTPDSSHIVFVRNNASGTDLWRIPAAGGEATKIAEGITPKFRRLLIHPDGRQVAFNAGETKAEIWVMENFLPARRASK
jgi:Periplasmic component of the Tol biopolymer transport system